MLDINGKKLKQGDVVFAKLDIHDDIKISRESMYFFIGKKDDIFGKDKYRIDKRQYCVCFTRTKKEIEEADVYSEDDFHGDEEFSFYEKVRKATKKEIRQVFGI